MEFRISPPSDDQHSISVKAIGRIVATCVIADPEPLSAAFEDSIYEKQIILDLAAVDFIDSSGMSWLLQCNKRFKKRGGSLVLHSCSPYVGNALKMLKLDQVLRIAASETEAFSISEGS